MKKLSHYAHPGEGVGYTPPMPAESFWLHVIELTAIIGLVLADLRLFGIL